MPLIALVMHLLTLYPLPIKQRVEVHSINIDYLKEYPFESPPVFKLC